MPAKETLSVSITIRPRLGINDKEVVDFGRWVGDLKGLSKSAAVLECPGTPDQHLHCGLLFEKQLTADGVKRRLWTLFAKLLKEDDRWDRRDIAIVCKAHHDFNTLVGGYFMKENHTVVFMTNVSEDELRAGGVNYEAKKKEAERRKVSAPGLQRALLAAYDVLNVNYKDDNGVWQEPQPITPTHCMSELIRIGKQDYLRFWPQQKKSIEAFWSDLIAAPRV